MVEVENELKELFEKKDFSQIFSYTSPKHIINVLLSLAPHHFSDARHYYMYKKFIVPKLRVVGKSWTVTPRSRHSRYLYYTTLDIVLSKTYCVLKFAKHRFSLEFEEVLGEFYPRANGATYRIDAYVLGFNSDGRLFTNKLGHRTIDYRLKEIKRVDTWDNYGVVVAIAEDNIVHQLLGYQYEHNDAEKIVINSEGRHRVQGEIILEAFKVNYNTLSDAVGVDQPIGVVNEAFVDYLYRYAANELMRGLVSLGFDVDYTRRLDNRGLILRHAVIVPGVINASDSHRTVNRKVYTILKSLKKTLNEYNIEFTEDTENLSSTFRMYNDYLDVVFRIDIESVLTNDRLLSVIFSPWSIDTNKSKLYHLLFHELRELMKNVKRQNYTVILGNHVINIKNAISLNVEYESMLKPKTPILSNWLIQFNIGYYYADNLTTVEIQHHEHGSVIVTFNGQYLIRFVTNDLGLEHVYEWNRSVVYALMNM